MMKVSVYKSFGDMTVSMDIEYSSDSETDCAQADKLVSKFFGDAEVPPAAAPKA